VIYDWPEIMNAYATGRGRVVMRGVAEIEENKSGKYQIIITQLPYQVNKAKLVAKIAYLVREKKLVGISDLRDESDRSGLRVVVDLKRDAKPKAVLNNLYKYTELQSSFPINMVALNSEGTPQLMSIRTVLVEYIRHRQLVVVRRTQFELKAARDRAHILEGLLIALNHLDDVIQTIRESPDSDVARERLMTRFKLTEVQAVAILDMQLRRLAALERQKIEDEYKTLVELMQGLCALLSSPVAILKKIADEVSELQTTYGDKRKTKLIKGKVGELSEEDLIPNEETVITLTETGYIKRQRPDALRTQNRGGMGATGITTRDEDAVKSILTADTHDTLLFFTNFGRTFKLKVYEIQESSRQAKGTAVVNLINLRPDETVQSLLLLNEKEDAEKFITLATRNGLVKKTAVKLYENIRQNGIIAITLKDNDELVWGKITSGSDDLMLITRSGKSIRFSEKEVKSSARDTQGVKGIELKSDDRVIGVEAFAPSLAEKGGSKGQFHQLLIVTERGIGKRTELSQYPMQKRAGQGVKVAEVTAKTGQVIAAMMVTHDNDEVVMTTLSGQMIKLPLEAKSIPVLTRATQGVILMRPKGDDKLVSVALTWNSAVVAAVGESAKA
jgi:DNA gyrase subunit A